MASRPVSARRVRIGITLFAAIHLCLVAMTLLVGFWVVDGAVGDDQNGAAVWYGSLAVVAAAPLAVLACAFFRLRRASPPLARRLTRTAWVSYGAIVGLVFVVMVAVFTMDAGMAESLIVMIPAVNAGLVLAPASLWYFKHRSAGAAPEVR